MDRYSIAPNKTSKGDASKTTEAVTVDAPATTIGIRIGGATTLTPQNQFKLAVDTVEKLIELVSKRGITGYQQVSGVATAGKSGLSLNTNVDLPADTQIGAYVNIGAGLSSSSTEQVKESLRRCLDLFRESITAV
jgi:hypothetical protein